MPEKRELTDSELEGVSGGMQMRNDGKEIVTVNSPNLPEGGEGTSAIEEGKKITEVHTDLKNPLK